MDIKNKALLQLNLLILMSLPSRAQKWIQPVFYNNGFLVLAIEPELSVPPALRNFLQRNDIIYQNNPKPELVLINEDKKIFMIIECKSQGFDIQVSDNRKTQQAVTFMAYNSMILCEDYAKEGKWSGYLAYILMSDSATGLFFKNLLQLADELMNKGMVDVNNPGVMVLDEREDGLYLIVDSRYNKWKEFNLDDGNETKIMDKRGDTPLQPLYLIPIDPTLAKDDYGYKVFGQRVRNRAVSFLVRNISVEKEVELDIEEDILKKIIIVWNQWKNGDTKRFVRGKCRKYVNDLLSDLEDQFDFEYCSTTNGFKLAKTDYETQKGIRSYFKKVDFRRETPKINLEQMGLDFKGDYI